MVSGAFLFCIEWMSSSRSTVSSQGRTSRARRNSSVTGLSGSPRTAGDHSRLKSSSIQREASGTSGSKASCAATFMKPSDSLPCTGRTSRRISQSSVSAPQGSLPCTMAVIATWGPGRPLSKVQT